MPTIGFGIPYYSRPDYLALALASLLAQTDTDWVAVVIDDASPEGGAEELVRDLADARIRYVRNPTNLGLAENFNRCLREPGTDVVAIFHADDVLEPGYVATIRRLHADHPTATCVAPLARAIDAEGAAIDTMVDKMKRRLWPRAQTHELHGDRGLARLMHGFFVYCPAISYRPALLPTPWFDASWRQVMDVELFARILLHDGEFVVDRTVSYAYRRHEGTVTAQNGRQFTRLAEETAIAQIIADQARAKGWRRTAFAARLRWSVRLNGLLAIVANRKAGRAAIGAAMRDVLSPR
jgi:glycosyltransferase involved in cell wall biosynthesis